MRCAAISAILGYLDDLRAQDFALHIFFRLRFAALGLSDTFFGCAHRARQARIVLPVRKVSPALAANPEAGVKYFRKDNL